MTLMISDASRYDRSSWLQSFGTSPQLELERLLDGTASLGPLATADPDDAAGALFADLGGDHPLLLLLDEEILKLLDRMRRLALIDRQRMGLVRYISRAVDALAIVRRLKLAKTAADLRTRYIAWNSWAEGQVVADGCDLLAAFLMTLGQTQKLVAARVTTLQTLEPLWLSICRDSGQFGPYRPSYLPIGINGLRQLPDVGESPSELPWMQGLALWASFQLPSREQFLQKWRGLKASYPRSPVHWAGCLDVVLSSEGLKRPLLAEKWWHDDVGTENILRLSGARGLAPAVSSVKRPAPQEVTAFAATLSGKMSWLEGANRFGHLVEQRRRYAQATGDGDLLAKTVGNIGNRILKYGAFPQYEKAALVRETALLALQWERANPFLWSLLRDALEISGAVQTAELITWEAMRRFPQDHYFPSQLAHMLTRMANRQADAEYLLRYAVQKWPTVDVVHCQLALLLANDPLRSVEVEALWREAGVKWPRIETAYYHLACFLWRQPGRAREAEQHLQALMRNFPDNPRWPNLYATYLIEQRRMDEAEEILNELQAQKPNRYTSRLLKKLARFRDDQAEVAWLEEEAVHLAPLDRNYSRLPPIKFSEQAEQDARRDTRILALLPTANARRVAFDLVNPNATVPALTTLQAMITEDQNAVYPQLLMMRATSTRGLAAAFPGSFAIAFEDAAHDGDFSKLDRFAVEAPLAWFGKALLGDRQAAELGARWLRSEQTILHPSLRAFRDMMKPHVADLNADVSGWLGKKKPLLWLLLREANDASLSLEAVAA